MDKVEEFLSHYGVKGMRWGVRKDRTSSDKPKEPWSTKKKVVVGVGSAAVVATGAVAARHIIKKNFGVRADSQMVKDAFDLDKMNEGIKGMYDRGELWDRPGMGRAGEQKTLNAVQAAAKRRAEARLRHHNYLKRKVKDNEFIRYNNFKDKYVIDPDFGWNPNNNKFGKDNAVDLSDKARAAIRAEIDRRDRL